LKIFILLYRHGYALLDSKDHWTTPREMKEVNKKNGMNPDTTHDTNQQFFFSFLRESFVYYFIFGKIKSKRFSGV
jgi:hypothetical protein